MKLKQKNQKTQAATLASFATDAIKLVKNKKVHTTLDCKNVVLIQMAKNFTRPFNTKFLEPVQLILLYPHVLNTQQLTSISV